ncbi:hypothetical protein, partial [Terrimonas pollutisoli]|uniref:hypothetical protein n=1 Tax=Terrimonas pollutisoli TaxID=3034147 RepID=UPI0023ED1893
RCTAKNSRASHQQRARIITSSLEQIIKSPEPILAICSWPEGYAAAGIYSIDDTIIQRHSGIFLVFYN